MKKVHFIAIGGAAMHNLALALHSKGYQVTGSDDEVFEPSKTRLAAVGILPEKMGWFPEKITKDIDAVILGMHAREDNPELVEAQKIGVKIYSFPEFLYQETKDKLRVVIGGSHGKTTTTAMILHVFQHLGIGFDYMVGAQIEGFDTMVGLSEKTKIAVFEGDEYLTSPIDLRSKFHLYHPNVALVTGIAWDHINVFPTFEIYVEQFKKFADLVEPQGTFIYFEQDKELQKIARGVRPDITALAYNTPEYVISEGKTYIKYNGKEIPLQVFGEHNLQNINAARLVCLQVGVSESDFYEAISSFGGAARRLQKITEANGCTAFLDFAHAPSKLRATIKAVKDQYQNRRLVACMELHTFSSLNKDFLPEYKDTMKPADVAYVYFNPEVIAHKGLKKITKEQVAEGFGKNITVFTDPKALQEELRKIKFENTNLLFMTSGNFSGLNLVEFAKELVH